MISPIEQVDLDALQSLAARAVRESVAEDEESARFLIADITQSLTTWWESGADGFHAKYTADDATVGFVVVKECWNLSHLFVLPESHGRGIGRQLADAAIHACRDGSPRGKIQLNSSTNAAGFYAALGFTQTGPGIERPGGCIPFEYVFEPQEQDPAWRSPDSVPPPLETSRFVLEPLCEAHVELDFAALMSCRARLREELQWGEWPPEDFSLERNRADLRRHGDEFLRGEAFAFTILTPDRVQCLGCIYLERCDEVDGAQLAFWVIDAAIGIEADLVADVLRWIHNAWSIDRVVIPLRATNTRGIAVAEKIGLAAWEGETDGPLSRHSCFLSQS